MLPTDRLYAIAQDVLRAIERHYSAQGVDLPQRRYVASGPAVAWDCEQVTVHVDNTYGYDGDVLVPVSDPMQAAGAWAARAASVVIELVRCHPVQQDERFTTVDEEQAAARQLYRDAQLCLNALIAGVRDRELPALNSLAFGDWQGEGPEGGYVGSTLRVAIGTDALGV